MSYVKFASKSELVSNAIASDAIEDYSDFSLDSIIEFSGALTPQHLSSLDDWNKEYPYNLVDWEEWRKWSVRNGYFIYSPDGQEQGTVVRHYYKHYPYSLVDWEDWIMWCVRNGYFTYSPDGLYRAIVDGVRYTGEPLSPFEVWLEKLNLSFLGNWMLRHAEKHNIRNLDVLINSINHNSSPDYQEKELICEILKEAKLLK